MSRTAYDQRRAARQSAGITDLRMSQPLAVRRAFRVVSAEAAAAAAEAAAPPSAAPPSAPGPRRPGRSARDRIEEQARLLSADIAMLGWATDADPSTVLAAVNRGLERAKTPKP